MIDSYPHFPIQGIHGLRLVKKQIHPRPPAGAVSFLRRLLFPDCRKLLQCFAKIDPRIRKRILIPFFAEGLKVNQALCHQFVGQEPSSRYLP